MKFFLILSAGIFIGLSANWTYESIFELDRQVHVLEVKDERMEYLERSNRFLKWELNILNDNYLDSL